VDAALQLWEPAMSEREFNQLLNGLGALSPEQLSALRHELDSKLAVSGNGASVTAGQPQESGAPAENPARRKPLWQRAAELRNSVPEEEWAKLPVDGSNQLDHYIYGSPKRPAS
jgi:hypothetical protein